MPRDHKRLGDLLLEKKLITEDALANGIAEQKKSGQLLGATLIRLGLIPEEALLALLQEQLSLPLVDLRAVVVDEQVLSCIKEDLAKKYLAWANAHTVDKKTGLYGRNASDKTVMNYVEGMMVAAHAEVKCPASPKL